MTPGTVTAICYHDNVAIPEEPGPRCDPEASAHVVGALALTWWWLAAVEARVDGDESG